MNDLSQLNDSFALTGQISFREDAGGLIVVDVSNRHATASIVLQGAHVVSWKPKDAEEVIWLSEKATLAPGKSIRGGIPICWPWFGAHESDTAFPAHGFARTVMWHVTETQSLDTGETLIVLCLTQTEKAKTLWPHSTPVEYRITVGSSLDLELITRNTGTDSIVIGDALHTYFNVSDVSKISISGLEGCSYLDKVENFEQKQQSGPVIIDQEVDRVYLDTSLDCVIDDPGMSRRIRVSKQGSHSTIVWNPWEATANKMGDLGENGYLNMVCVESANAANDVVTIEPGDEHHLKVSYTLE